MSSDWCTEQEEYLTDLARICQELAQKFKTYNDVYKRYQTHFRIPNIILSTISSLISFTSSKFESIQQEIVLVAGGTSLFVALLTSLETYFKLSDIITGSIQASINFQKLAESIAVEISLPRDIRDSSGIVFVKECHGLYEKYWEAAPPILKRVRFIRQLYHGSAIDKQTVSIDATATGSGAATRDEELGMPTATGTVTATVDAKSTLMTELKGTFGRMM